MSRPEEIEGYEVPLHIALTQPILMGGAPRTFAILNGTLALVIGMGLHLWWLGFPAGAALHAAAALVQRVAKLRSINPDFPDVNHSCAIIGHRLTA
jgi:type IV secretion system protein VirB3